ncbi:histidine--tRNA ligase [Micromonospora sagamiensis]|uniref:Histidine--tRNA ligase n=1 Tax=Micromonospora sagamiensis TaxID=47875 RepID=A0A562WJD3_9ACTN|nr:histidine--tRNA ligase [Micromonospora sagamiensis]TWJ30295.1 histidyl-tRNA synthetase [Micromonospora sagamiensis]BCL16675.1 histidine--tRNA ligase [Micromonospora sagamiensis]
MSQHLPTSPYRGTRDFLPAEMSVRTQVFHRLYEVIERYGFARYDGPILESAEIYEAKSGQEIADLQLYTLTDRGGRRLALRPEMTPSVARMIAANANKLQFPVRWYCHVNCHRYERPQRGRVREHWQINVDTFGSASPNVEIEIFELIHDMMAALGASRDMYVVRASDRVLLDGILTEMVGIPAEKVKTVAALIDRWDKYPHEQLLEEAAGIGVSPAQFDRLEEALSAGEKLLEAIPADVMQRSQLAKVLDGPGRELVTFDPFIVRGLAYYTSTVFEVFDRHPANSRALFGGGRYSDLVNLFSDAQIPGFGFGMGDVTLFDFLETHGILPEPLPEADVVVIPSQADLYEQAASVARILRGSGWRTSVPLEPRKLGKEISRADKTGARAIVIVGPSDWAAGNVVVRGMASGDQQTVTVDAVATAVAAQLDARAPEGQQ